MLPFFCTKETNKGLICRYSMSLADVIKKILCNLLSLWGHQVEALFKQFITQVHHYTNAQAYCGPPTCHVPIRLFHPKSLSLSLSLALSHIYVTSSLLVFITAFLQGYSCLVLALVSSRLSSDFSSCHFSFVWPCWLSPLWLLHPITTAMSWLNLWRIKARYAVLCTYTQDKNKSSFSHCHIWEWEGWDD